VKREIGFTTKVYDGLRRLVIVENREIVLTQVADKFAVLVGGNEKYVDFVDAFADGEHRARLRIVQGRGASVRA
jgi:hypothetical protein